MERLDWEMSFKQEAVVHIQNLYGNIYIKKSNDDTMVFHAVVQNHDSRKEQAKLDVLTTDDNPIELKIKFDQDKTIDKERVDVAILVPNHVKLVIEMKGNQFTAKKLKSPIKLISQSTDIQISTSAAFDIFTKSGQIDLKIAKDSNFKTSKVQSHNGSINIQYGKTKPYFSIVSGHRVVSNSAQLLLSKTKKGRNKYFNSSDSSSLINIISDSGRVTLINNLIQ